MYIFFANDTFKKKHKEAHMGQIYLIGNAHLDPVWQWRWQEGFSEILSTFRSALDRMKDFPDFKFTSACCVYYEWIEKVEPNMFEEIKQRVKEGRWNIVGGWFLQPDCNIPCGESFVRHALISQRYFKEKFEIIAKTCYNVDSFGHSSSLPQILKKSGLDNYVFMRPQPHENENLDDMFIWESDDGSQVTTYRIPWFYNFDLSRMECFSNLDKKAEKDGRDYMAFYGVGNHGGGPTIRLIHEINKLNLKNAHFATVDEYFDNLSKDNLAVHHGELQNHARGCYSACSFVKIGNKVCESNLVTAEKLAVLASKLTGAAYPHKKLKKAWKNLLFNQFHDILAGCAIKSAYKDAGYLYGEIMSVTEQIIAFSMQKIMRSIDTLGSETLPEYKSEKNWRIWEHEVLGTPIVIFNPHSWEVNMPVQIESTVKKVVSETGNNVPFQYIRAEFTDGNAKYSTLFNAKVPAYGYTVYRFFMEDEQKEEIKSTLCVTENSLENEKIKVVFDEKTGEISSFYLKESDKYIISKPCSAILVDETDCDTWAHDKKSLGNKTDIFGNAEFKVLENGPCRGVLSVTTKAGNSVIIRNYIITPDKESIEVKAKIDFHEKHKALKFAFPISDSPITVGTQYGTITRQQGTGEEFCGAFIAANGLCVANSGQYGYDSEDNEMRMTILRGAIYTDHFGVRDELCEYMEQGIQELSYMIFPCIGKSDAFKKSDELNIPLRFVTDSFHKGFLPEKMSCFASSTDNLIITAIKEAEDKNGIILRGFETDDKESNIKLRLFETEAKAHFSHNEIKTLKMKEKTVEEVNLIEW